MNREVLNAAADALFWTNCCVQLTIPSILAQDEHFRLRITIFGPDALPIKDFPRRIDFETSPGIEGLPKSIKVPPDCGGCLVVDNLRAVGPDHAYVVARPQGSSKTLHSNPAWVRPDPPYRIYWGDIHVHTTFGNCCTWSCKSPEFCYLYARDITHLDFAAAADHLRGIASDDTRWPRLQQLADLYYSPGSFVPFLAFESSHMSGSGGDNNAYFLDTDSPYFWLDRDDMRSINPQVKLTEMWDFLDATGRAYFTAPHHTGRISKYRSFADADYNQEREPLFEIYSMWGSSESRWNRFPLFGGNSDAPCYFQDALKAGCRFGVIASSDCHLTMPGGESEFRNDPAGPKTLAGYAHKGLAAVRAPQLTRESLFDAMTHRNCYATTFDRVLLDFQIDDLHMGQSAAVSSAETLWKKRTLRVNMLSLDFPGTDVFLLCNSEEIQKGSWQPGQPQVVFQDDRPLDQIAIRDSSFHPQPFAVYYVRLENRISGSTQWSSPIWLDLGS